MAKQYKVLAQSFINNTLVEAGAIVEFDGEAGENLEEVKAPAKGKGKGDAQADAPADANPEALV